MKSRMKQNRMIHGVLLLAAVLGGMTAVPGMRAQPAAQKVDSRFLFVFDTSSEMKHRVTAVQNAVNSILATSVSGQLHSNDSIGVWTFAQQLQTGQFPLQRWNPDHAVTTASNINAFVHSQRYAKKTSFDVLLPLLGKVVQSSERLTVVIFCDGYGVFKGTPYDIGINQVFQQRQVERHKAQQPIVIVLHSQLGQYVDCMVSFPPQSVSFPPFPPLPEPVAEAPAVVPAPAPPRPSVPPLIIIGTPPTNRAAAAAPAPKPLPANPPPLTATTTSPPAAAPGEISLAKAPPARPGGISAQLRISPGLLSGTNATSPPARTSRVNRAGAFAMGVAFLVVAGGLTVFLSRRIRAAKKD